MGLMGKEPLMKFKISKEIIDKTIKCEHKFDCLAENSKNLCNVVQTTGNAQEVIFVEPSKKEPLSQIILNEALCSNCKFLLIGKHNLSKAQEFLFGDTAINIIRKSPIPVIVVTSERERCPEINDPNK